jgi:transposase
MNTNSGIKARSEAKAKEEQTAKLGLDVHAGQITVCRQQEGLLPQPAQRMSWERCLGWIQEQVENGAKVYSCYEAGPCGYGLHRQLTALGVTNYVVAPQRWDERGQRVKTDKHDARELVDRLDRYVRGNTKAFAVVRVPTPQQEQERSLVRQRGAVLKERTRCVLRGHGILLAQGFRAPSEWWKPAHWFEFQRQLPAWLREQVELWQLKALNFTKDLERLDREVEALSRNKAIPKGLGLLTSSLLGSEILDWHRFKNRRQVASYTGLCPSEHSSGEKRKQGSISKHGNPRVRHQLVEAVWRLQIWQPTYPPLKKLREASGARMRKRVAVAVARRLAVDLWRIETGQCSAQKLGLTLAKPSQA